MTLARGRRLPGPHPVAAPGPTPRVGQPRGARVPVEVVEAAARARSLVAAATAEAERIRGTAAAAAAAHAAECAAVARTQALAELGARELALAEREERSAEAGLARSIDLARALAERLLGEALALEPGRVAALARQALREAAGARRARVHAHPADAELLRNTLGELAAEGRGVEVVDDATRSRGSLRIQTDLGELDAELGAELDRLVRHLRESLAK